MRLFYNIGFIVFALLYLPYFLLRGKYHKGVWQRFGIFDKDAFKDISASGPVWVHAVSVGEMMTAEGLIDRMRRLYPSKRFVISTVTETGNRIALSSAREGDMVIYFPIDLSFVVRKLAGRINPSLFIAIETEIWPNLFTELAEKKVPIVLMNGRISPKSFRNYRIVRPVMRNILDKAALFCMRTDADAERIKALGAPAERVRVTGNMKFDNVLLKNEKGPDEWPPIRNKGTWLKDASRLIIAGSTHRGEEIRILRSYKALRKDHPGLALLIAPRHIERTNEVSGLTRESGFSAIRMSEVERGAARVSEDSVFLLDSIGHLGSLYELATIVFMGGSLIPHGGQNFIEPAAFAKPVITGPYVHNFKSVCELFASSDAIEIVRSDDELLGSLRTLLADDEKRKGMGERAKKLVFGSAGSTDRNIDLIKRFL